MIINDTRGVMEQRTHIHTHTHGACTIITIDRETDSIQNLRLLLAMKACCRDRVK